MRIWRAYLAGSAVGFEHGDLGVVQVLAVRGDPHLPFGRDRMLDLDGAALGPGSWPAQPPM